jgi:hypothetical protein
MNINHVSPHLKSLHEEIQYKEKNKLANNVSTSEGRLHSYFVSHFIGYYSVLLLPFC